MLQDGQEILEGRFQIIKKVGSGAFGEIYKGKKSFCYHYERPTATINHIPTVTRITQNMDLGGLRL